MTTDTFDLSKLDRNGTHMAQFELLALYCMKPQKTSMEFAIDHITCIFDADIASIVWLDSCPDVLTIRFNTNTSLLECTRECTLLFKYVESCRSISGRKNGDQVIYNIPKGSDFVVGIDSQDYCLASNYYKLGQFDKDHFLVPNYVCYSNLYVYTPITEKSDTIRVRFRVVKHDDEFTEVFCNSWVMFQNKEGTVFIANKGEISRYCDREEFVRKYLEDGFNIIRYSRNKNDTLDKNLWKYFNDSHEIRGKACKSILDKLSQLPESSLIHDVLYKHLLFKVVPLLSEKQSEEILDKLKSI
jgi:hypothetical protein